MKQLHQLPLVGLLLFLFIPKQLCKSCEVNEVNRSRLNPLWNIISNSQRVNEFQAANVLLSLELVRNDSQSLEQTMMQKINATMARNGSNLSSGQLAWIIMALGACHNTYTHLIKDFQLVQRLEKKFQEEIKNMGTHNGNPLTNYYELSQDLLALCLFGGNYSVTEIATLFTPENKNYYFGNQFSVDTGAMAVLALTCVRRSIINQQIEADKNSSINISNYIELLVKKILSEKKENGLIGDIYSTGEAMQALFVSSNSYNESDWDCQQTLDTVLKEISQGVFSIPTAAAQILPALLGKTYLDVNKNSSCVYRKDIKVVTPASTSVIPTKSPALITVHYSVQINKTYSTNVTVPSGSVFLDVMEEAQKQNETIFGFTWEEESWGPYITSVQGLLANNNDRTYWEILSGGQSLSQGVGSYVVHNGEYLEIRWSKY